MSNKSQGCLKEVPVDAVLRSPLCFLIGIINSDYKYCCVSSRIPVSLCPQMRACRFIYIELKANVIIYNLLL